MYTYMKPLNRNASFYALFHYQHSKDPNKHQQVTVVCISQNPRKKQMAHKADGLCRQVWSLSRGDDGKKKHPRSRNPILSSLSAWPETARGTDCDQDLVRADAFEERPVGRS